MPQTYCIGVQFLDCAIRAFVYDTGRVYFTQKFMLYTIYNQTAQFVLSNLCFVHSTISSLQNDRRLLQVVTMRDK